MYNLKLNKEEYELLEKIVCLAHSNASDNVKTYRKALDARVRNKMSPLEVYFAESLPVLEESFETIEKLHTKVHNLEEFVPEVSNSNSDCVGVKQETGFVNEGINKIVVNDKDFSTIKDINSGNLFVHLDINQLLRIYAMLAVYKNIVHSTRDNRPDNNKLKGIIDAQHYVGNLIRIN